MEGQISFLDNNEITWRHYPGCTKGYCPVCGKITWYGPFPSVGSYLYDDKECECGAKFNEDGPPKGLPVLSGINDLPIRRIYDSKRID